MLFRTVQDIKLLQCFIECSCQEPKSLFIFDFDDTLIVPDKTQASWIPKKGPVNVTGISATLNALRIVVETYGPESAVVLTARSVPGAVQKHLRELGLGDVEIHAVGHQDDRAKAWWIDARITNRNLTHVVFLDDKPEYLQHAATLRCKHPHVEFQLVQVVRVV